jgi:DNA-directed RNA polymerase subunit RPC12/RpoP
MYGRPDQVGQKIKCPDCGAQTAVPPPPPPRAKNVPAALEGEQYELWDADAAPLPSELATDQPKYVPLHCTLCGSLMQATLAQVGTTITCPDCGRGNVVPPPAQHKPTPDVLAASAETYALQEGDLAVEPPVLPHVQRLLGEVAREEEAFAIAAGHVAVDGMKPRRKLDARGRPIMPRRPLTTGILTFLFSPGVPARWLALSLGFMFGGYLLLEGIRMAQYMGLIVIAAFFHFLAGFICCLPLLAATASIFKDIVTESAEGNDQVEHWNTRYFGEWFVDLLFFVMTLFASVLPGWGITRLITADLLPQVAVPYFAAVACFPIVYLSQLHLNSPWGILSGRIAGSWGACFGSWLLFYVETFTIWALCFAVGLATVAYRVEPVLAAPLYVGAVLLYARLLGRLAWRLSDALAEEEVQKRDDA